MAPDIVNDEPVARKLSSAVSRETVFLVGGPRRLLVFVGSVVAKFYTRFLEGVSRNIF